MSDNQTDSGQSPRAVGRLLRAGRDRLLAHAVFVQTLAGLATLVVLLSTALTYWGEAGDRRRERVLHAWGILHSADSQRADAGRSTALETLWHSGESLDGLTIRGALLENLRLRGPRMESAVLTKCELDALELRDVVMVGCDLEGSTADRAILSDVEFERCRMKDFSFTGVGQLDKVSWRNCDNLQGLGLQGQTLTHSEFSSCILTNGRLNGIHLENSTVTACVFVGCRLDRATVSNAEFRRADLTASRWNTATVEDSVFSLGTNLSGVDFSHCTLSDVTFTHCNFSVESSGTGAPAVFRNATLERVRFESCNLQQVDFSLCKELGEHENKVTIRKCETKGMTTAPWQDAIWVTTP